jgi:two-component system, NtrC family, sensor kinase
VGIAVVAQARGKRSTSHAGRLLLLGLTIGLLAITEVWRTYRQAVGAAERHALGFTHLLAEQTERTIHAIDLTLIGMRDALQVAPSLAPNDPTYHAALKERLKSLPYLRALFVIGADGYITHDTDYPMTPRVSLEDRPYFQAHRMDASLGLHIGHPLQSRSVSVWFVSFSRRMANPDGSFAGIVVAAVEPRYFERLYDGLSIGEENVIALLLRDGTLLARAPDHKGRTGTRYADGPARKLALAHGSGVAWTTSPVDGIPRLVGYRTLASGDVIVLSGWSEGSVFDAWQDHAIVVTGGSALVWLLTAGLALVSHGYRRRAQLEQARLAQSQRLETMGRIAGGVAHDLGNTIKIARATFTLLKPALAPQREAMTLVEEADRSLKSAFEIIDRLLAFARRQELIPRPTDLAELIEGFAPILRQAAGPRVELALELGKPLLCTIDPIHLESALLNLVLNSRDAMPEGGRIVVDLHEVPAPRRRCLGTHRATASPPWAEIAVKDDGAGMPRDVQERAFEPFFTTRTNGSGLGLSQVLGFVQQSAGEVMIESQEGGGTTVCLRFPTTPEIEGSRE